LDPEQVPDSLTFLDEATASLDESSRAELYHLLKGELPATKHRLDRAIAASLRRGDHCASGLQQGRKAVLTYLITKASARAGAGSIRARYKQTINSGRVALQGIVHDAKDLLIVLISLPFAYFIDMKIRQSRYRFFRSDKSYAGDQPRCPLPRVKDGTTAKL
jgi:hypothetical protein